MIEVGMPGSSLDLFGLTAPAGTPREIVDKLARAATESDQVAGGIAAWAFAGRRPDAWWSRRTWKVRRRANDALERGRQRRRG